MGNSKKTASKSKSQERREAVQNSDSKVEARPIGEGKDPLAEGNTLENPSNTEAETHYDVKERGADVQAQDAQNKIDGQDANARAEAHNAQLSQGAPDHDTPNHDEQTQDAVADGRTEEGEEPAPEEPETPESDAPDGTDTETDPLAAEANDKAV